MRYYTLANAHPLDARIFTSDGGLIEAGSRADAERICWDMQEIEVAIQKQESTIAHMQSQLDDEWDDDEDRFPNDSNLDDLDDDDIEM